ncbi:glycosyltransferase [Oceanobacillus piezotolerans]|uniref:Glycosyltransferase n=1 Tax=Oceanobacillus piezotolerans TaxID=2448030 RepID=A0A498DAE7_9BACI|nr:glycosyltransferase [Oceanobacillus piezotolerans]RLL46714.1 glycosyltransferase [Oceanobacillus piezotolerans]
MKKKVLFISDHGDPLARLGGKQSGGQNNYVKQLALALDQLGLTIDVVTHWSNPNTPQIEGFGENCRVIRIAGGHKGYMNKSEMVKILPAFYKEMKEIIPIDTYDIIHSHYWISGLLGLVIKNNFKIPLIHTSHSLAIAKYRGTGKKETTRLHAEKNILRKADTVIATTTNEKDLIESFAGPKANVVVSSIGVNQNIFYPYARKRWRSAPVFSFAGRLEETKGIVTLLQAFKQLNTNLNHDIKLIIAGGDDEEVDLVNFAPKKKELKEAVRGIENNVMFVGSKTQEELADIFNESTAVVVPSYYESFGMVAAEAQACGTPVIASGVGGLQNVVSDGFTGLHVEPKNPDHLLKAMSILSKDKYLAKELGQQAAEYSHKAFNWEKIAKQMDMTYERLIGTNEHVHASY